MKELTDEVDELVFAKGAARNDEDAGENDGEIGRHGGGGGDQ